MPKAAKDFYIGNKMIVHGESFEYPAGETAEEYAALGLVAEETKPDESKPEETKPAEEPAQPAEQPAQPVQDPAAPPAEPVEVEGSPDAPHGETVAAAA